ncbi:hypothetical protein L1987_41819 [Smallanthus sonchifolius]|uniref:Uncharacterized protein n=1 Tax=Smallanthus sonchifolius TaxID=185202 RepID=A0ACB9GVJ1_9ASTR|nr:hypothetical protein L1987_41819 [Smallanthus sonchifolius]
MVTLISGPVTSASVDWNGSFLPTRRLTSTNNLSPWLHDVSLSHSHLSPLLSFLLSLPPCFCSHHSPPFSPIELSKYGRRARSE